MKVFFFDDNQNPNQTVEHRRQTLPIFSFYVLLLNLNHLLNYSNTYWVDCGFTKISQAVMQIVRPDRQLQPLIYGVIKVTNSGFVYSFNSPSQANYYLVKYFTDKSFVAALEKVWLSHTGFTMRKASKFPLQSKKFGFE